MTIRSLLIVTVVLAWSALTFGQTSRGTVSGVVTDPNGAVIAGAEVTLTSAQTKLNRTTKTNSEGLYRFEAVDPGSYSVNMMSGGWKKESGVKATLPFSTTIFRTRTP